MLKRWQRLIGITGAIVGLGNGVLCFPAIGASPFLMQAASSYSGFHHDRVQSGVWGGAPRRSETPAPRTRQARKVLYIRPRTACPTRLEELIPRLLRDLPSYANRVSQRAALADDPADSATYVLLAGRPEYEPLTQGPGEYLPTPESDLPQVFFTTLERQYIHDRTVTLQVFHWLFLTQTRVGWRLVLMQSAIAPKGEHASHSDQAPNRVNPEPPTPPQDSSQGVIGQAVRLWLRDCEAGSVGG